MNSKILFGVCVAVVFIIAEVSGRSCPCQACGFGPGQTNCDDCKPTPYGYRPISLKPTKNQLKLQQKLYSGPVEDDLCNCRTVKVKPVALPKPKYIWKEKKEEVCDNSPLIPAPDHFHDFTQDEETYEINPDYAPSGCNYQPLYPVDAVSIDLVNRMKQSAIAAIPEGQLQYGFFKLPKDMPTYKINSNIPEEKLNTFERQIVELKNPRHIVNCGNDSDEEIVMEDREPHPVAYLSYKDLGFVPESAPSKKFITACKYGNQDQSHEEYKGSYCQDNSEEDDIKYKVKSCGCSSKKTKNCGCQ